jgi:hypothetical protein
MQHKIIVYASTFLFAASQPYESNCSGRIGLLWDSLLWSVQLDLYSTMDKVQIKVQSSFHCACNHSKCLVLDPIKGDEGIRWRCDKYLSSVFQHWSDISFVRSSKIRSFCSPSFCCRNSSFNPKPLFWPCT